MEPLRFTKHVVASIEKCYAVCPMTIHGTPGFLLATEKAGGCFFFDLQGQQVETIWDDVGGVMSLVSLSSQPDAFLSTQEFFSPNDSAKARIVLARWGNGQWLVRTVAELPFVHRFDVFSTPHQHYLVACTLKSGHDYKEDWSHPGKVLVCPLPEDLAGLITSLEWTVLLDNLTKNHGYYRIHKPGGNPFSLISSDNGVYKITPPDGPDAAWGVEQLLAEPASDATLADLDQDGVPELITFSPFHGDTLSIFHYEQGTYRLAMRWPKPVEFLHALWSGSIHGTPTVIIGHRKGSMDLFALRFDTVAGTYICEVIDEHCGSANVAWINHPEFTGIVAANRETNQVAMYRLDD
ncbi:MAG: hypothetical protein HPY85_07745 [Anaerolineae bacterium]|nr:hypothetical protein [Anaerolineae bacterium]